LPEDREEAKGFSSVGIKDEEENDESDNKFEEDKDFDSEMSSPSKHAFIKVPRPTDILDIPEDEIKEEDKPFVLGTRRKLNELIDLVNTGNWKKIKTKKETKIFVRKSERGNI